MSYDMMNVYIASPSVTGPQGIISFGTDPAREDWRGEDYQHELRRAIYALQTVGVEILSPVDMHKSADSGLLLSGSFNIAIETLSESGRTVLGAWVRALGRKVRIKAGDVEIEASTAEEVERLFGRVKAFSGG